jgi:hypothetical protein
MSGGASVPLSSGFPPAEWCSGWDRSGSAGMRQRDLVGGHGQRTKCSPARAVASVRITPAVGPHCFTSHCFFQLLVHSISTCRLAVEPLLLLLLYKKEKKIWMH